MCSSNKQKQGVLLPCFEEEEDKIKDFLCHEIENITEQIKKLTEKRERLQLAYRVYIGHDLDYQKIDSNERTLKSTLCKIIFSFDKSYSAKEVKDEYQFKYANGFLSEEDERRILKYIHSILSSMLSKNKVCRWGHGLYKNVKTIPELMRKCNRKR